MKNTGHAGLITGLASAFLLAGCTGTTDGFGNDEEAEADSEAVAAMVQAVLDVHAAHRNGRRPARLVMGSWEYVAEANTDWSHRLAEALRGIEEQMMEDSPEAPWLLSPFFIEGAEMLFEVHNREDPNDCCPTVALRVWLRNGELEFRASDGVGYADYVRPPQDVLQSIMADEEQYLKERSADEDVQRK